MTGYMGYNREAVRVKVKKYNGNQQPEYRKFCVDPQITSFEVLQSLLARAFDIKGEFAVKYLAVDDCGQETYLSLLSDWDLDAAFLSASDPCLCLRVELRPFEDCIPPDEWDLVGTVQAAAATTAQTSTESKSFNRFPTLLLTHVEKTLNSIVQRALNFAEENSPDLSSVGTTSLLQPAPPPPPPRPPLTDSEFRSFMDTVGQLVRTNELRLAIFQGGIEPSLRRVVWKHILNVYPVGLTGKERMDYMKRKSAEYQSLRDSWKDTIHSSTGTIPEEVKHVTNMVRKDVLRTDRHHQFYAGTDENENVVSLFNILTTYSLNHPSVGYCQGMSDLASPLLVIMGEEAHAYICFCALMRRLAPNFQLDGDAMTLKFQHLTEALLYHDPEFFQYLKARQADDLLFCYRWLLLELKREFAFDDALHMLEVLWASLPPEAIAHGQELPLFQRRYSGATPPPPSPGIRSRETAYAKVCAMRRRSSTSGQHRKHCPRLNHSLDESSLSSMGGGDTPDKQFRRNLRSLDETCLDTPPESIFGSNDAIETPPNSPFKRPIAQNFARSVSLKELKRRVHRAASGGDSNDLSADQRSASATKLVKNLNEFWNFASRGARKSLSDWKPESVDSALNRGSTDDLSEYIPITTKQMKEMQQQLESLDSKVFGPQTSTPVSAATEEAESQYVWSNPLPSVHPVMTNSCEEATESDISFSSWGIVSSTGVCSQGLPPPLAFGGGNPFLMFLCLTLLLQHRDHIIRNRMDYNELAMHFDKMVRKHDVRCVLHQARRLFSDYLRQDWGSAGAGGEGGGAKSDEKVNV